MKLPSITTKQQEILQIIYKYRFIDRIQIQSFLGHKDKRRVSAWLKDLREKQYIEWIYDKDDFAEKTKPAIYFLSINGIRYLKTLERYPKEELSKRYKDSSRKQPFIARSLLIAVCCNTLADQTQYTFETEADYINPESDHHFLYELRPHLYFSKQKGETTTNYLLEVFDITTPRYMVKKRLKDYLEYLDYGEWEREMGDNEPPIVLLIFPTVAELIYAKRRTRRLLEDIDDSQIHIRLTTTDKIMTLGIKGEIWEVVGPAA